MCCIYIENATHRAWVKKIQIYINRVLHFDCYIYAQFTLLRTNGQNCHGARFKQIVHTTLI